MYPDKDTVELNAMLTADRRSAAQERDAAHARLATHAAQAEQAGHAPIVGAAGSDSLPQVMREETDLIEYLTGRHDAHDFVLEDMEASLHPEELGSFLDQRLTEYIASADSLQKVKGFSSVVVEVNDFRLSC